MCWYVGLFVFVRYGAVRFPVCVRACEFVCLCGWRVVCVGVYVCACVCACLGVNVMVCVVGGCVFDWACGCAVVC